jgi:hypothetical protein
MASLRNGAIALPRGNSQKKQTLAPSAITMKLVSVERNTMNIGRLRQLWTTIEETHTHCIHSLNDTDLVQQLLHQLNIQHPLNSEESQIISSYLKLRLPLIRDMA